MNDGCVQLIQETHVKKKDVQGPKVLGNISARAKYKRNRRAGCICEDRRPIQRKKTTVHCIPAENLQYCLKESIYRELGRGQSLCNSRKVVSCFSRVVHVHFWS